MERSPLAGNSLRVSASEVMAVCNASLEFQASRVGWPQLTCPGAALKLAVTGATATVELAIPAWKRGSELRLEPADHSLMVCLPACFTSTMTRWFSPTVTGPDHISLSFSISV